MESNIEEFFKVKSTWNEVDSRKFYILTIFQQELLGYGFDHWILQKIC